MCCRLACKVAHVISAVSMLSTSASTLKHRGGIAGQDGSWKAAVRDALGASAWRRDDRTTNHGHGTRWGAPGVS